MLFRTKSTWFLLASATLQLCFLYRAASPITYQTIKHNYLEPVSLQFLLNSQGSSLQNLIYKIYFSGIFLSSLKWKKYRCLMHQDCVAIDYIMPLKSPEGPKFQWMSIITSENWLNNDFHLTFHLCSAQAETYPRWSPQCQQPQRVHTSVALIFHRRSINPSEFICDTDCPGNQPPSTGAMQSSFSSCCFSVSCD